MATPIPFHGNHHRDIPGLAQWTALSREEALEPDLPIVDPHHHLWDDERGRYLLDEFVAEMSGHNVVSTIYAQFKAMYRAEGAPEMKPVGEVEFANGLAAASASGKFGAIRVAEGIIAHADMLLGDNVKPVLEALVAAGNGRLRGIRHGATWDGGAAGYGRTFAPRHMMCDPAFHRSVTLLSQMGLSLDAWLFYTQLDDLAGLLTRFPDTNVILDHVGGILGTPPHIDRDEVFRTWRRHIERLAQYPNLSVKIGGLGMLYCGRDFHLRKEPPSSEELAAAWRPYVESCIELFGIERCMFESNFPMDKQSCSYGSLWNAFKRITENYSLTEKLALYHNNAVRVYRLPRASIAPTPVGLARY